MSILAIALWFFTTASARAADFYVSLSGNNNNPGTESLPFKTLAFASRKLGPGDTLYIRAGTWLEPMTWKSGFAFRSGTPTAYTRYAAFKGEKVVLRPGPTDFAVFFPVSVAYIELRGLEIDATNAKYYAIKIDRAGGKAAHHIRLVNNELRDGYLGIQGGGESCEIIGNRIHHFKAYGIYGGASYATSGGLFEGNTIHHCGGHAIHLYQENGGVENNIIRNNVFYENGHGWWWSPTQWRQAAALRSGRGKNNRFYNNVFFNNHAGIRDGLANTLIANNTVYGSAAFGIEILGTARVVNNIVWGNKRFQIDNNQQSTYQTNLTVDPKVINAGGTSPDFRLTAQSPAIGRGLNLRSQGIEVDFAGRPRPPSGPFDIGAHQFGATTVRKRSPTSPSALRVR